MENLNGKILHTVVCVTVTLNHKEYKSSPKKYAAKNNFFTLHFNNNNKLITIGSF